MSVTSSILRVATLSVAGLVLAACASGTVVATRDFNNPIYTPQWYAYAASGRDLAVIVRGNPTAAPQADFASAVTAAMNAHQTGPKTNFTISPSDNARKDFRVVMLFGGTVNEYAACDDPHGVTLAPASGGTRLNAVFCYGQRPMTAIQISANGIGGPGDPTLGDVVSAAMLRLFPAIDYLRDGQPDNNFRA